MSARVDTAVPMAATPSGDPMRILVVEDEVKTASFIRKALQAEGFAVDVLYHGDQVLPAVETLNPGLKSRTAQLVTWNGTDTVEVEPSSLVRLPPICSLEQLVGLNVNPGLLIVTFTCLICSGIPSSICGIA